MHQFWRVSSPSVKAGISDKIVLEKKRNYETMRPPWGQNKRKLNVYMKNQDD